MQYASHAETGTNRWPQDNVCTVATTKELEKWLFFKKKIYQGIIYTWYIETVGKCGGFHRALPLFITAVWVETPTTVRCITSAAIRVPSWALAGRHYETYHRFGCHQVGSELGFQVRAGLVEQVLACENIRQAHAYY